MLYHLLDRGLAPAHLDDWLTWASRSGLAPFVRLARTLRAPPRRHFRRHRLGLSNGRLEGLNSKIPPIATAATASTPPPP